MLWELHGVLQNHLLYHLHGAVYDHLHRDMHHELRKELWKRVQRVLHWGMR